MEEENLTQEDKILNLLRERGKEGAYVWDFMMPSNRGGLGIAQYNARIWGLRKKGYIIENVKPGHFVLEEDNEKPDNKVEFFNVGPHEIYK